MADSLLISGQIELLGGGAQSNLPQCTGAKFRLTPGWDLSAPQPITDAVISLLLDGSRPVGDRSDNRVISLPVVIMAADRDILAAAVEVLLQTIDQGQWSLTWTRDGGLPVVFDCFRATPTVVQYNLLQQQSDMPAQALKISFPALPYIHADTPVPLTFDSPFSGTLAPPSSVELDNYATVDVAGWSQSTQHVLDSYSAYWSNGEGGFPTYTRTFPAADISQLSAITWWLGLGTGWQDYWGWNRGQVTFSVTLTDGNGSSVTFGTTMFAAASNNPAAPNWTQITVPLPYSDTFDFSAVVGYQWSCWTASYWDQGQQMQASVYLNAFTAAPASASTPASTRGWMAKLYGIEGSAHAPIAVQFQLLEQGQTVETFDTPGPFSITPPDDVVQARVQLLAGGGTGATMTAAGEGGAGSGAGYGEEPAYPIVGGATYNGVIGGPNENTTFDAGGEAGGVLATAGTPATENSSAGAVAADTSTNSIHYPGGDGAAGTSTSAETPDLLQQKPGSFTGDSGTITLSAETTAGSCLVVVVTTCGSDANPSVESVLIGGDVENFAQVLAADENPTPPYIFAWLDPDHAGGQTEITVTLTGGEGTIGATVEVFEWADLELADPLDQSDSGNGEGGTFTSGTTGETGQLHEVILGAAATLGEFFEPPSLTGPSSGWTNQSMQTLSLSGLEAGSITGYKVVSTEQTAAYAGTVGSEGRWNAAVLTLKGGGGTAAGGGGSSAGVSSVGNPGDGPAGGAAPTGGAAGGEGAVEAGPGSAGASPGGGGGGALSGGSTEDGGEGGNGQAVITYQGTTLAPFSTLIAHIPGPDAPASLIPFVSVGNGGDVPNGGTEYLIASAAPGVAARFGGTYSVLLVAETINDPSASRTLTVTILEHEYEGGTVTQTPVGRTLVPDTAGASDLTSGLNGILCLGQVTLPTRDIAPDNTLSYFGVTVTSTDTSDRFLDVLFIDTAGQLALINMTGSQEYDTYYLDVPDQTTQLGRVLGSQGDRNQAASVIACAIVSGGPLYVNPGDNTMLVYSLQGAPSMVATYRPAFRIDRPS
jgi:hypothetical protein